MKNESEFSNFDTEHAYLIIINNYDLYIVRKSFINYVYMRNFYSTKHEICNYVQKDNIIWSELYRYLMKNS